MFACLRLLLRLRHRPYAHLQFQRRAVIKRTVPQGRAQGEVVPKVAEARFAFVEMSLHGCRLRRVQLSINVRTNFQSSLTTQPEPPRQLCVSWMVEPPSTLNTRERVFLFPKSFAELTPRRLTTRLQPSSYNPPQSINPGVFPDENCFEHPRHH